MSPARLFFGAALLEPGRGGIARVARMSARALIESNADVDILSYLDETPIEIAGQRTMSARGGRLRFALMSNLKGLRGTHALYDSIGMTRAHPRFMSIPYAFWMMGAESWERMRSDHLAAARRANLALAISEYTLERHQSLHGPLPQARVCWLGTEQDEPPATPARFDGPPVVLIVGRIDASEGKKGHDELIGCWPRVVDAISEARLVIVGGGSGFAELGRKVGASRAARAIELLGHVPEAEMSDVFARAHVFAMPSRQEGFGIAYVEAMRFGLPVIASRGDAGQEINVDGITGYTIEPGDTEELADRLIHLLRNPDLCAAMGRAGHARWRDNFRYSCFARRFLAIWDEFVRDHPGAAT